MWRSSRELAFHHAFIRIASSSSRCYGFHQALRPLGLCPVPHLSSRHSELSVALNEPRSRKLFHTQSSSLDRDGQPTIYALSTASGRAAIAVIRISGSACRQVSKINIYLLVQTFDTSFRFIPRCVQVVPSLNLAMPLSAHSTTPLNLPRLKPSSTQTL